MERHYSSLFSTYSRNGSYLNLQSIFNSSKIITISITNYKKSGDLSYFFTREINNIISNNPKAFSIHNGCTSVIYLYSDYEEQNYEVHNNIFMWLKKLQIGLKKVRFHAGVDKRTVQAPMDVILSELMAYTRMLKNIHSTANEEQTIIDKGVSFINEIKTSLNNIIEYNNYNLQSPDVIEISQCLDVLINRYMYYGIN